MRAGVPGPGPVAQRVGANVRTAREVRGWTLAKLSERMAEVGSPYTMAALSRLETGKRSVTVDMLAALGAAFDVHPGTLLDDAHEHPAPPELLAPDPDAPGDYVDGEYRGP